MNKRGFTLVELLVTVSVLLIAVGIAGDLIISVIRSYNKTRILQEIEQNGNYTIAKITHDFKNAIGATAPTDCSSGASPQITISDSDNEDITYSIETRNGSGGACSSGTCTTVMTRTYGSNAEEIMTNYDLRDGVDLAESAGFCTVSDDPLTVKIELTLTNGPDSLNSNSKSLQARTSFDTIVQLRGVN